MIPNDVIEVAQDIGKFYLQKHNNNYKAAQWEIANLRITNIELKDGDVHIKLHCVGLFIGRRGENILNLEKWLNKKVKLFEEPDDILYYLIPRKEEEFEEGIDEDDVD